MNGLTGCQSKGSSATEATTTTADSVSASKSDETNASTTTSAPADPTKIPASKRSGVPVADAATIIARPQVPVLCYHQVRDWRPKDSKSARDYIIPTQVFNEHMQMLADSGYTAISPDQLYAYLTTGAALPKKPVMISFDDGNLDQYETAVPIMDKHGFKASFFIMTVAIGRRGKQPYMDKTQLKDLADRGHTIGAHTWDHHNVKKYQGDDWKTQIEEPNAKLESITGKPVRYFAYPFGLWNEAALPELQKRGYLISFALSDKKLDPNMPLQTIRRIIAGGQWSAKTLHRNMVGSFD